MSDGVLGGLIGFGLGVALTALLAALRAAVHTRAARRDAVLRSQAVITGKVHEQLVPHLPGFEWNPRDARFLGSPVDFVVFDGLATGAVRRVVFLEIKTGSATVSPRERQVRDAVRERRVEWRELRVGPSSA